MKILQEAAILARDCEEAAQLSVIIELRAVRLLAVLLQNAVPGAVLLELLQDPAGEFVAGAVMDDHARPLTVGFDGMVMADDFAALVAILSPGGSWEEEARVDEVDAPENAVWVSLNRAIKIEIPE